MPSKFRLLATAVALFTLAPGAAHAEPRDEITQAYATLKTAMAARDAKAIKALLTKDFSSTDARGGTSTADEMISDLARLPTGPDRKSETTVDEVAVDGTTAKVAQHLHATATRKGKDGADHLLDITTVSDDVWTKASGAWLLRSTTTRAMVVKRDGQEVFRTGE